jgi:hypothetical protein
VIALPVRVIGIGRNGRSAWPEYAPGPFGFGAVSLGASFDADIVMAIRQLPEGSPSDA